MNGVNVILDEFALFPFLVSAGIPFHSFLVELSYMRLRMASQLLTFQKLS
jgi:hypothetical protein